jgi:putative membrane protein
MGGVMLVMAIVMMGMMGVAVFGWGISRLRSIRRGDSVGRSSASPRRILDERYARGELSSAEYEERRAKLDRGDE